MELVMSLDEWTGRILILQHPGNHRKCGVLLFSLMGKTVLLLDKTGAVTAARPQVVAVETFGRHSSDDVVRHAASIEQVSIHPYAPAIMSEARNRSLDLVFPTDIHEEMGTGISGIANRRQTLASAHRSLRPHVVELAGLVTRLDTLPGTEGCLSGNAHAGSSFVSRGARWTWSRVAR